jgi:hypothetical protein
VAKKGTHRAHVSGDRLWDARGDLWLGVLGTWADGTEVEQLLTAQVPVVVHGFGRPFRTLSSRDARRLWAAVRWHFEVPGSGRGAAPDREGLTYAAQVWTRDGQRLLGFVESC